MELEYGPANEKPAPLGSPQAGKVVVKHGESRTRQVEAKRIVGNSGEVNGGAGRNAAVALKGGSPVHGQGNV